MRDRFARQHYADNYFFAVRPDAETAEKIAAFAGRFCKERGLRGSLIPAERQLASLSTHRTLGEWPLRSRNLAVPLNAAQVLHLIRPVPPYDFTEDAISDD